MRLRVDMDRCEGHGMCAVLAARVVDLDQWGFPLVPAADLRSSGELAAARRALAACPRRALRIEDLPEGERGGAEPGAAPRRSIR